MEIKEIKKLLVKHKAKISTSNILCIGDMILDHYIYGNVVRNITSLGSKVTLLNLSGFDDYSKKINHLINKNKLQEIIKKEVYSISYPYGAVNRRVRDMAEKSVYTLGFTSRPNINKFDRDPLLLCRNAIWSIDSENEMKQKITGKWDWMRFGTKDPIQ